MKLAVDAPINSLSFGNVSINLLREMYKKQMDIALFPVGEQADLDAFDKLDKEFVKWLQKSIDSRYSILKSDLPTLKIWHINGSEKRDGADRRKNKQRKRKNERRISQRRK